MNTFIITYDLVTPATNQEQLVRKIRGLAGWARLGVGAYLIKTDSSVLEIRDQLSKILQKGDKLFVGTCPAPSAWSGQPEDVSKWIMANQQ